MTIKDYISYYSAGVRGFLSDYPDSSEDEYRIQELTYYKNQISIYEKSKDPLMAGLFSTDLIPSLKDYQAALGICEYLMNKINSEVSPNSAYDELFQATYDHQFSILDQLRNERINNGFEILEPVEKQLFNDINFIGVPDYDNLYDHFLGLFIPGKIWRDLLISIRELGNNLDWAAYDMNEPISGRLRVAFSDLVHKADDKTLINFFAKRRAWIDWDHNCFPTKKGTVQDYFSFMLEKDDRKKQRILSNEEFNRLVKYVTFFFDKNFELPTDIEPIKEIHTSQGNVWYAFSRLFKKIHPGIDKPDSLAELIIRCFENYNEFTILKIRKSWGKRPPNFPGV